MRWSSAVIAHLLECVAKRPQAVVDTTLDRSLGHAQLQRHLGVGPPSQVGLDQHSAVLVADAPQRLLDLPADQDLLEWLVSLLRDVAGHDRAIRARPAEIDHHATQDRKQPGPERADLRVESVAGPPRAQESVL